MPDGAESIATIIGIDPGSDTMGVGVIHFDVVSLDIVSSEAFTLNGTRNGRGTFATEIHGDRQGRIESHREKLLDVYRYYQPLEIACESPFMSRRMPSAFGALTETVSVVRQALMQYDVWKVLNLIDPPTVKRSVGVAGNTGGPEGKKLMQQAILRIQELLGYDGDIPIELLDEHSVDGLAVAFCHFTQLMERLCLQTSSSLPQGLELLQFLHLRTRTIRAAKKSRRSRKKTRT
jgi:Holliday junction resolvasome RuvABC endonuclease subunit